VWPEAEETQKLLAAARSKPAEAMEQLLAKHREPVRRLVAMRLDPALAPRIDSSDIVQEVLLEASRRLPDYLRDPVMPFHLWLRHIAKDHIIDAHRRHRLAQRRSIDREQPIRAVLADQSSIELLGDLIDRELTPATAALRREMEATFQEAVNQLDEDDREIILLRHFEQLSNQDVAKALDLSEAAASMRYLRALRRLRAVIAPA
jgi:RNA polymerase sigma-70 factor (ECF subfamily)